MTENKPSIDVNDVNVTSEPEVQVTAEGNSDADLDMPTPVQSVDFCLRFSMCERSTTRSSALPTLVGKAPRRSNRASIRKLQPMQPISDTWHVYKTSKRKQPSMISSWGRITPNSVSKIVSLFPLEYFNTEFVLMRLQWWPGSTNSRRLNSLQKS